MKPRSRKTWHWLRWALLIAGFCTLVIVLTVGYVIRKGVHDLTHLPEPADERPACGTNVTQIALGSPYDGQTNRTAYFATDGSDLYVSARHFEHGGYLDPKIGVTRISIGDAAATPIFNEQTGQVENTKLELTVHEGKHKKAQLPAGRYWLWSSTGGDIVMESCGKLNS